MSLASEISRSKPGARKRVPGFFVANIAVSASNPSLYTIFALKKLSF